MITGADQSSGFADVLAYELVLGLGIGLAMAPATESVMGALPLEKAGVGSAVNDATRTTGGALGVAILGSVLSSIYRGDMTDAVTGLPAGAAAAARDSLSGALALGDSGIAAAARDAFVSGMHGAVIVAAAIALAGGVLALVALPARERNEARRAPITPALEPVPA